LISLTCKKTLPVNNIDYREEVFKDLNSNWKNKSGIPKQSWTL